MNRIILCLLPLFLTACGASESVGVAAVAAKSKADEIQAGKQLEAQTRDQVQKALAADQQNLKDADAATH